MAELILLILLLVGLIGMAVVLYKKIPALTDLPESSGSMPHISQMLQKVKEKSKEGVTKLPGGGKLDHELYLQKILSKVRVLTLKTESKTSGWLEQLRRKRNNHDKDDYWKELKKAKNGKKPA